MTDQMSDADFLRGVLDHLGSPEDWCKGNYVQYQDAERSQVKSLCLEGAMIAQLYGIKDVKNGNDFRNSFVFAEWDREMSERFSCVNQLLAQTFQEQFPEINGILPRTFNDHESMTYEGVRSVVEKTIAKLEENA